MEWISVLDYLPEERVMVLAYQDHPNIIFQQMILCQIQGLWYELNDDGDIDISGYYNSITHWAYLPKAPKTVKPINQ